MPAKPDLRIVLCSPRGFCAGVVRAIDTVERALAIYGAPVYVRHEIVHNRYVVDSLKTKGAIFVEELAEIPDNTNAPVVFSAHGVPKSVPADARARNFFSLDATCPLVTKVHREAAIHFKRGREILLIGHSHHPEVVGTLGQLPAGAVTLIETAEDAKTFTPKDPAADANPMWAIPAEAAFPSATENEIDSKDAANLLNGGVVVVNYELRAG